MEQPSTTMTMVQYGNPYPTVKITSKALRRSSIPTAASSKKSVMSTESPMVSLKDFGKMDNLLLKKSTAKDFSQWVAIMINAAI